MTTLVTIIVTVLTGFVFPIIGGSTNVNIEGSSRFGLTIEDPREMANEENQVTHWQYCP